MYFGNKRIEVICRVCLAALGATVTLPAMAQTYPVKPIRFIVPFAPGGGTDLIARTIGQRLTAALGQPVVVDNRAGAGGVIGADLVAKAAPDGYTLMMGSPGPLTINPNLRASIPYSLEDFAPITLATISPFVLVVNATLPVASVKDLIVLARSKPGALNFGSGGNGSVAHLAGEQFKALAGVQITHVPYKGSSQSVADLLGNQVQIVIDNSPVVLPHIRSGLLKALAVGIKRRSTLLPDVPTMSEAGVPGYEASTAFGVLAAARAPREIVARLNREIVTILRASDVKERFAVLGVEAVGSTPDQYAEHLRAELAQYGKVIKAAGIKIE
jgi:tripartite-type tricarboxylate transporter receptor subunit TctC